MTGWLVETLVWTAVLIAAVLVLRRPVTRWFGPQVAYALWAIPALRLLVPPLELPAWMRPQEAAVETATGAATNTPFLTLDPVPPVATTDGAPVSEAAATGVPAPITPVSSFDIGLIIEIGAAVWLIGAVIFLAMRFTAYFRLRDELLESAQEVGRDGAVRLVETPGTNAPLAFGVIDKVIALPSGFLAQTDRTARDLALAHEMAHHQGRDLLINVLVQPLFALHWFNPLGHFGWLALRRDQEAACDARVIAARPVEAREAYANLIVSFAARPNAAPNHALAAPMACPVLGEKSIIHRLRSLKMTDTSNQRRFTGRLLLGAAVIALPLTATISYAASEVPTPAALPAAPPAAPGVSIAPPAPPAPPSPPSSFQDEDITEIDPDGEASGDVRREENVFVIRTGDEQQGERREERIIRRVVVDSDGEMSEEDIEEIMVEVREGLAEADRAMEDIPRIIEEAMASAEGAEGRTIVRMSCNNSSDEVATTTENADGTRTVMLCQTRVMAHALEGLKEARAEIAESSEMSADMRDRIVRELDQQIARWEDRAG